MNKLLFIIMASAMVGCMNLPGNIDSERISGIVYSKDAGLPISNALVLVKYGRGGWSGPPTYWVRRYALTDADGNFTLEPDPAFVLNRGVHGGYSPKPSLLILHRDYACVGKVFLELPPMYEGITIPLPRSAYSLTQATNTLPPNAVELITNYLAGGSESKRSATER